MDYRAARAKVIAGQLASSHQPSIAILRAGLHQSHVAQTQIHVVLLAVG